MRLAEAALPTFARHETFHPRYGWFRKAYNFVANDPYIFSREDAPVRIGVGKNMARAIRFWGLAAKLICENEDSRKSKSSKLTTTNFGDRLFGESGWDMYMEDPGTLWLLHWQLFAPPARLPIWWLTFCEFSAVVFTPQELERAVLEKLRVNSAWATPHHSSIKKDINVLLRTYTHGELSGRTGIEDILDCPLRELNLIKRTDLANQYRFALGAKHTLPAEILIFSILDYIYSTNSESSTIPLSRLVQEPGSPGKVFKLTENDLLQNLQITLDSFSSLDLITSMGVTQLSWLEDLRETSMYVLDSYYDASVNRTGAILEAVGAR